MRFRVLLALFIATGVASAQQTPTFDAASVKPSAQGPAPLFHNVTWPAGGRMTATGLTVRELIQSAYLGDGLQLASQIIGGPDWIDTDRFDIAAKEASLPSGNADDIQRQRNAMLRSLLADRFKLKVHADTRPMQLFDLVLVDKGGKLGPQMRVSTCSRLPSAPGATAADRPSPCRLARMVKMDPAAGVFTMGYEGMTMLGLARALSGGPETGRPIRDRTGLIGAFDLELTQAAPTLPGQPPPTTPSAGVDIFTALQEQLGLKLESRRDQADVIVIDSVERPGPD